jgi:hypothetical protein
MVCSSADSRAQAEEAVSIGPGPAPEYISAELSSGGSEAKSSMAVATYPTTAALAASVVAYEPELMPSMVAMNSWTAAA